ncbi:MAG: DUF3014 domain-containing protein [Gammaproteobacteria bacterium]|nr:DUF3014 domain-containing protein [Gammaproteobacteria bacterium]
MNNTTMNLVFLLMVVAVIGGGYYYWQSHQPKLQPADVSAPPPALAPAPPPKPPVRQVIEPPPPPLPQAPPVPKLAQSDNYMLDALAGLINNKVLMKLLRTERVIPNIVATIDNLPRNKVPIRIMPVEMTPGDFLVSGSGETLAIDPKNAARYTSYLKLAEAIDTKKLVDLYVRLYPLFQQAYQELGFPDKYFNDRLIETVNDLLETPSVKQPIPLVVHSVYYQFADPDLEGLSSGQRIMLRIGADNAIKVKAKLRDIKQELLKHMHEQKVDGGK